MVSNSALAALCVKCEIHNLIDMRAHGALNSLDVYVSALTAALREEERISAREGRLPGQYWLRIQTPKVCQLIRNVKCILIMLAQALSDVMEGILGALYISDNCTLEGAEKFFNRVFKPFFDQFVTFEMLARHAADAVLEMLDRLGCRQYSRAHNFGNGVHSCKRESALFQPRCVPLKGDSYLAREHLLRSQGHQFGRSDAKDERKMLANIDGEAETLEGRVQLSHHPNGWGDQSRSEEKINLFAGLSVDKNGSLFLRPKRGVRLYRGVYSVLPVLGSLTAGSKKQRMESRIQYQGRGRS